jgi:hypothetical protein
MCHTRKSMPEAVFMDTKKEPISIGVAGIERLSMQSRAVLRAHRLRSPER